MAPVRHTAQQMTASVLHDVSLIGAAHSFNVARSCRGMLAQNSSPVGLKQRPQHGAFDLLQIGRLGARIPPSTGFR